MFIFTSRIVIIIDRLITDCVKDQVVREFRLVRPKGERERWHILNSMLTVADLVPCPGAVFNKKCLVFKHH